MKSFKAVEETRRLYHADGSLNSVHRASLLAPVFPQTKLEVSFLNHFLLKRGYKDVACRVTEVNAEGKRIRSRMFAVDQPRAYVLPLSDFGHDEAADFMVEFFSGNNFYIPFPAVMVNHRGTGFLNSVHAYNRVLNDVFEDDSINAVSQREAAIDVRMDGKVSTFLLFSAGQSPVHGKLNLRLNRAEGQLESEIVLDVPRFGHRSVDLLEAFPGLNNVTGGVLTVAQPKQFMFYGRMLAGQRTSDGAFSANHSYYDSSEVAEYWDDARSSARLYPYFDGFDARVRFYPILSPGRLRIAIEPRDMQGRLLGSLDAGLLETPGPGFIDVSVAELAHANGIDPTDIFSFAVRATPEGGNTPTRVNHQLVYGAGGLESSINMSLNNPNVFMPAGKKGFSWGQMPIGDEFDSRLGITTNLPDGEACSVDVTFYNSAGKVAERRIELPAGAARTFTAEELLPADALPVAGEGADYVWFELRSERPDVYGYSVVRHTGSGHCSGEHGF